MADILASLLEKLNLQNVAWCPHPHGTTLPSLPSSLASAFPGSRSNSPFCLPSGVGVCMYVYHISFPPPKCKLLNQEKWEMIKQELLQFQPSPHKLIFTPLQPNLRSQKHHPSCAGPLPWAPEPLSCAFQTLVLQLAFLSLSLSLYIYIFCLFVCFLHWRRKWQPTPVLLPGKSHGRRSLVGHSPWGRRVRHDWATSLSKTSQIIFQISR